MPLKLIFFILFFGGFSAAFICLLIATILLAFAKLSRSLKRFYLTLAFCGLLYQGGCFALAASANRDFGSGTGNDRMGEVIGFAFLVFIIWSFVILSVAEARENKHGNRPNNDAD